MAANASQAEIVDLGSVSILPTLESSDFVPHHRVLDRHVKPSLNEYGINPTAGGLDSTIVQRKNKRQMRLN